MNEPTDLIDKYLAGKCTAEERALLLAHFNRYFDQQQDSLSAEDLNLLSQQTWSAINNQIRESNEPNSTRTKRIRWTPHPILRWLPYAAAILLVATAIMWYSLRDTPANFLQESTQVADIAPGGNRATLTLSDGSKIDLSEAQTGIISDHERIVYEGDNTEIASFSAAGAYGLQLTTPNGGTYQVTLPDGTKVWLNAASSLTYPSHFDGRDRVVTFSGEAYFEVAKDASKPFRVMSRGQQVDVLGTKFNISAYPDDDVTKTTLIEGSVRISSADKAGGEASLLLEPSEKAELKNGRLTKEHVDADNEAAWRTGVFAFRSERLESIMKKVARWYDVDIELQGDIADRTFTGTVSRYENISGVLETLALTNLLSFEINGKKLIVKSK
ncbi:FecR domain-containing protein [Parapedobacter defluvii]|uniref:FecR family protein n=1 Tax=Parapedobacter defluvii TaxID=2045106 RepID=UPI0033415484